VTRLGYKIKPGEPYGFPHLETPVSRTDGAARKTYLGAMPIALAYSLGLAPFLMLGFGLARLTRA
jgi:hypothetical protein